MKCIKCKKPISGLWMINFYGLMYGLMCCRECFAEMIDGKALDKPAKDKMIRRPNRKKEAID